DFSIPTAANYPPFVLSRRGSTNLFSSVVPAVTYISVVDLPGSVADVEFRFDGTSCNADQNSTTNGLACGRVGDLLVTLTSPSGITVRLTDHNGGSKNNFCNLTFDDSASSSITTIGCCDNIGGVFRPIDPLSVFNGLSGSDLNGIWTVTVAST